MLIVLWRVLIVLSFYHRALAAMREEPGFNLTLDDFRYFNETPVSEMISEFMLNTTFKGISVSVQLFARGVVSHSGVVIHFVSPHPTHPFCT